MICVSNGKLLMSHEVVMKGGGLFKRLFPFAQWRGDHWEVMATPQNIENANVHFGAGIVIEEKKVNVTEFLSRNEYFFKIKPYRHQLEALATCDGRKFFAYFMEPGLGKTKVAIDDAMMNKDVEDVLVVCPKSVLSVWEREIKANGGERKRWCVINHDLLITENGFNKCRKFLMESSKTMMILDESTFIANHKSQRTEACMKLGVCAEYRRILTGDPIANTPIDLYSQLNWLSPECVKNRGFYAFRNHFCDMGGFRGKQIIGYKNTLELKMMVSDNGYRVRTKDVLGMPKQNWLIRNVELNPESKKLYDRIVEEEIISLFDGQETVSAAIILTKMMKLQQVCGGTIIDDDGISHVIGTEKLDELKSMLKEFGKSGVLVWHQFRAEGEEIRKELSKEYETELFNGDLKSDERKKMIAGFENGEFDVLVIQNDAGHLGITLNNATYAVFYSNHMRPIVRSQSERRNWRIGRTDPVFYYDLLCGKIDRWIYDRIKRKREFNATITDRMTKQEVIDAVR